MADEQFVIVSEPSLVRVEVGQQGPRGYTGATGPTGAAVATTASTFAVAVAWGSTALSLATTESASFATGTTKARRVQPIGVITFPVGAAIGAVSPTIQFDFEAPLVINPGEYVQVIAKPLVGTATASEVFQWIISPNAYHE